MVSILVGASKIMAMVSGVENCAAFVSIFLFLFFFFLRLESSTKCVYVLGSRLRPTIVVGETIEFIGIMGSSMVSL